MSGLDTDCLCIALTPRLEGGRDFPSSLLSSSHHLVPPLTKHYTRRPPTPHHYQQDEDKQCHRLPITRRAKCGTCGVSVVGFEGEWREWGGEARSCQCPAPKRRCLLTTSHAPTPPHTAQRSSSPCSVRPCSWWLSSRATGAG